MQKPTAAAQGTEKGLGLLDENVFRHPQYTSEADTTWVKPTFKNLILQHLLLPTKISVVSKTTYRVLP